jgi:HEAT repeat protein
MRKLVCCLIVLCSVIAAALLLFWPKQKVYQGKTPSQWSEILRSSDDATRDKAAAALAEFGIDALPYLLELLESQDSAVQLAALNAIKPVVQQCLSWAGAMNCVTGFVPGKGKYLRAEQQIADSLKQVLRSSDPRIRREAAHLLLSLPGAPVIDAPPSRHQYDPAALVSILCEQLGDEDPNERIVAVGALSRIYHPAAVTALLDARGHRDEVVRSQALDGLIALLPYSYFRDSDHKRLKAEIPALVERVNSRPGGGWMDGLAWAFRRVGDNTVWGTTGDGCLVQLDLIPE